jgi:hypothetical protein
MPDPAFDRRDVGGRADRLALAFVDPLTRLGRLPVSSRSGGASGAEPLRQLAHPSSGVLRKWM